MDSLPESEINIPIQVNLKPIYSMAEKRLIPFLLSQIGQTDGCKMNVIPGTSISSAGGRCK